MELDVGIEPTLRFPGMTDRIPGLVTAAWSYIIIFVNVSQSSFNRQTDRQTEGDAEPTVQLAQVGSKIKLLLRHRHFNDIGLMHVNGIRVMTCDP